MLKLLAVVLAIGWMAVTDAADPPTYGNGHYGDWVYGGQMRPVGPFTLPTGVF